MDILERLQIPACDKTRIPVKELIEQLEADASQRKLLESHIKSMYLVSLLNEKTIRIRSYVDDDYSFHVIYVFEIELKVNNQITDFTNLVHSAFPESTLLILKYKENTYLSGALKRINKVDKNKTVIEDSTWEIVSEDDDIKLLDSSYSNLKELYEGIMKLIYSLNVKSITNVIPKDKNKDYKTLIKQYNSVKTEINRLKEEYSSASMSSEKLKIDNDMYRKEKELERIGEELNGK